MAKWGKYSGAHAPGCRGRLGLGHSAAPLAGLAAGKAAATRPNSQHSLKRLGATGTWNGPRRSVGESLARWAARIQLEIQVGRALASAFTAAESQAYPSGRRGFSISHPGPKSDTSHLCDIGCDMGSRECDIPCDTNAS